MVNLLDCLMGWPVECGVIVEKQIRFVILVSVCNCQEWNFYPVRARYNGCEGFGFCLEA